LAPERETRLRLFAAVEIPAGHRASIERAIASLKSELPALKWTRPESWHMTLKFFGEVAEADVSELAGAIARAARGCGKVESQLEDIGAFPSPRRARVLWVGLADPQWRLKALARAIEEETGYPKEERFTPHLTLARLKEPQRIGDVIDRHRPFEWDSSPFLIDRAVLLRSVLGRPGARYERVEQFPFS
jgi:2'-5' RNA ligase